MLEKMETSFLTGMNSDPDLCDENVNVFVEIQELRRRLLAGGIQ